jgi:hypothetical protein
MNKFLYSLSKLRLNLEPKHFNAMLAVKGSRPLLKHMINVSKVVVGRSTANWVRLTYVLMTRMYRLFKKQGLPGLIKYQKACCVIIQQSIGGHIIDDMTPLGPRVSRSKGGLPRILPKSVRSLINKGDETTIKWCLSMFSIYRVIIYSIPPKFSSITDPRVGSLQGERNLRQFIPLFLSLFIKGNSKVGLACLSAPHPFAIFTSSPNADSAKGEFSTSLPTSLRSFLALWNHPRVFTNILAFRALLPYSSEFERIWKLGLEYLDSKIGRVIVGRMYSTLIFKDPISSQRRITYIGKLGLKVEAAGKVRVFAMVDCFTQWVLKPLHRWIFSVLRDHPSIDGTFDQMRPLHRVPFGRKPLYSYDLSSATDRLPISLQVSLLSVAFSPDFGRLWKEILVGRSYWVRTDSINTTLNYSVGQPMGALSSWGMLALTHHFIVQCSAWMAGKDRTRLFTDYCVLGDDILIWDSAVAKRYLKVITSLGVSVGLAKSVISMKGTSLEFAKKTLYKGVDVSPIPLKEYSAALSSPAAFMMFSRKYHCTIGVVKSLLGLGYKSSLNTLRLRVYFVMDLFPSNPEKLKALMLRYPLWRSKLDPTTPGAGWYDICGLLLLICNDLSTKIKQASSKLRTYSAGLAFADKTQQIFSDNLQGSKIRRELRDIEIAGKIASECFLTLRNFMLSMETFWMAFRAQSGSRYTVKEVDDMSPHLTLILNEIMKADRLYSSIQLDSIIHPTHTPSIPSHKREMNRLESMWNLWSRFSERHVSSSFFINPIEMIRNLIRVSRSVSSSLAARSTMTAGARYSSNLRALRFLNWKTIALIWGIDSILSIMGVVVVSYLFWFGLLLITTPNWWYSTAAIYGVMKTASDPSLQLLSDFTSQFPGFPPIFQGAIDRPSSYLRTISVYLLDVFGIFTINSVFQNFGDVWAVVTLLDYSARASWFEIFGIPIGLLYKFGVCPLMDLLFILPDWLCDRSPIGEAFWGNEWIKCALGTLSDLSTFIKDDIHYIRTGIHPRSEQFNFIDVPEMSCLSSDDFNESDDVPIVGYQFDNPVHPLEVPILEPFANEWTSAQPVASTSSTPDPTLSEYKSYFRTSEGSSSSGDSSDTMRPNGITVGTPFVHIIPLPDSWYLRGSFILWRMAPLMASGGAYIIVKVVSSAFYA